MIESAEDIISMMGWKTTEKNKKIKQKKLFTDFTPEEEKLINVLKENGESSIDYLCLQSQISMGKAASALLNLEFEEVVKSLPGKRYKLV